MKDKRKVLFVVVIVLILLVIIFIFNNCNRCNLFKKFFYQVTNTVTEKLDYETISGNVEFKVNSGSSLQKKNMIIDNINYKANYNINLKNGFVYVDVEGYYDKESLKSNIYISNNKINLLLESVFDKYIVYDNEYLDILNNASDYRNVISILNEELNILLKTEYFNKSEVELNDKKVTKIILDLTKGYYDELKEDLINDLASNQEFMTSYSNIYDNTYTKKQLIQKIHDIDMNDYKISLYFSKFSNEFIKLEVNSDEIDINIENKDNKYSFQYYLRDGLMYEGYLKIKDGNISEFNLIHNTKKYFINLKFDELNIGYNKEVDSYKEIKIGDSVNYLELTESDKSIIRKNGTINTIYNNYLNRYYHEDDDSDVAGDISKIIDERDY